MIKRIVLMTFAACVLLAGASIASAQSWHNLGTKEVKDRSEQDTWHISAARGEWRRIKFTIGGKAVRFYKCVVTYGNGEKDEIPLANVIRAGGETRAIDLKGVDRVLSKVDIWYEAQTVRRGVRSSVTLWGYK